jgi:two-component system, chemotaxis family, protein-glutamate methylesterase/glutaminase
MVVTPSARERLRDTMIVIVRGPLTAVVSPTGQAMQNRDIVVIGGSAGALEPLQRLLGELPADLPAALFVVVHTAPNAPGALGRILDRAGLLPADLARDGLAFEPGRVYVAPPDLHLLLDDGHMLLRRGPRENLSRPAIDPLFRSAAAAHGARVSGLLLSGMLYDGASGLRAIKRCGGIAVVQDPADALYPDMPRHALQLGDVDYCPSAADLSQLLAALVAEPAGPSPGVPEDIRLEVRIAAQDGLGRQADAQVERPVALSCPDCGGALREITEGELLRYRCHVGHAYDAGLLLGAQTEGVERALWTTLRALEDRAALLRRMARQQSVNSSLAGRWAERAAEHEAHAQAVRSLLVEAGRPDLER